MMPTVSVIIAAYNAERDIGDAVRSVLDQTIQDFEIIVVDDGSTDTTMAALTPFGSRVRVHQQQNQGVAAARNAGARLATGEWLAFLDADDLWMPRKLEKQLALAMPMTFTDRLNIGARGDLPSLQSESTPMHGGDIFVALMRAGNFVTTSSVMIRRVVFEELGGFCPALRTAEDWDLWLRVAARYEIGLVLEPLVQYRLQAGSLSRSYTGINRDRIAVISRALALPRGGALDWKTRRQIWAETHRTNGWDAGRSGSRVHALAGYARAAASWPLSVVPYKEAIKVCLNV
jgi:glycosyltransferase involved in cell wall biosynthesis